MNKTSDIAIFDCHFHIIEKEFPLQVNNGYIPDEFTIENYYDRLRDYSIQGGAVVSCLLYTSPSPRDLSTSRMPSSA